MNEVHITIHDVFIEYSYAGQEGGVTISPFIEKSQEVGELIMQLNKEVPKATFVITEEES